MISAAFGLPSTSTEYVPARRPGISSEACPYGATLSVCGAGVPSAT